MRSDRAAKRDTRKWKQALRQHGRTGRRQRGKQIGRQNGMHGWKEAGRQ